ncbi:uncharacterized protein LOC125482889 [Rhincodon typus]|uniref:uncharacterized protein LOC125482889 n=1 Tax=Rhincodon typus TaxID=259920 RepID=UPI00202F2455|nr:uncharacterized protein LOC125482889 [Rhincodon typus]
MAIGEVLPSWVLLLLLQLPSIQTVILSMPFQTAKQCTKREYFDISRMVCRPCGADQQSSSDGTSCVCLPGYKLVSNNGGPFIKCKKCPAIYSAVTQDGWSCIRCPPGAIVDNHGKCQCPMGYILAGIQSPRAQMTHWSCNLPPAIQQLSPCKAVQATTTSSTFPETTELPWLSWTATSPFPFVACWVLTMIEFGSPLHLVLSGTADTPYLCWLNKTGEPLNSVQTRVASSSASSANNTDQLPHAARQPNHSLLQKAHSTATKMEDTGAEIPENQAQLTHHWPKGR